MHGLHADPQLKQKILNALKTSPGSPIWVNGICIYRGYEKHFDQFYEPRGRPFEQPHGRRRSRSPGREVRRMRSRSPIRKRSYSPLRRPSEPVPGQQRRELFPIRTYRTPSPQRARTPPRLPDARAREPARVTGSNAVVFNPRVNHQENQRGLAVEPVRFQVPPKPAVFPYMALQAVNAKNNDQAPRQPLGEATNATSSSVRNNASTRNGVQAGAASSAAQERCVILLSDDEPEVEDPYFVLGISQGAMKGE
jgi:hypothetical protein